MKGHCLCGAVTLTAPDAREIGVCHCGFCRRWSGGPMFAVHAGKSVAFRGVEYIAVYASSDWAERAFCRTCGTHLYYKLLATGEYFVPAGALDTDDFEVKSQIYVDNKPGYYALANETPMLTEREVVERFTAGSAT